MEQLNEKLKNDKICLSYLGAFSDEITDKLIGISEFYLENKTELGKLKNKVSFLIAECFQNIVRHGGVKEGSQTTLPGHSDFFQINILEDRVVLSSCNLIGNNYVESLEQKMLQVNSLNSDELKKLYNEVLSGGEFSDKGGAGLGLIEMARKSGLPLKYSFRNLNETKSQFFLFLEIIQKKESVEKIDVNEYIDFYKLLLDKKTLILYKGDVSKDIIISVIDMLQNNFSDEKSPNSKEKKFTVSLIEFLQNISKHGKLINGQKEGIFSISKDDNFFTIEGGNYIGEDDCKQLESSLSLIKELPLNEISTLYKKRLLDDVITSDGNCGLGLLEIAKNCEKNFEYSITPTPEKEKFFSIKIKI
ncbi:MAG: SiaB family protein kinase [Bacteroidota bacterium]|nr:SiaB family protein kinase [Bacteroidota bacterium]MDP3146131.1 SiaB family protein kinase [Bacteroidota bacterium]MDP3556711.1 SiaB family protein kinase [Bacteroidota bacterium]